MDKATYEQNPETILLRQICNHVVLNEKRIQSFTVVTTILNEHYTSQDIVESQGCCFASAESFACDFIIEAVAYDSLENTLYVASLDCLHIDQSKNSLFAFELCSFLRSPSENYRLVLACPSLFLNCR